MMHRFLFLAQSPVYHSGKSSICKVKLIQSFKKLKRIDAWTNTVAYNTGILWLVWLFGPQQTALLEKPH